MFSYIKYISNKKIDNQPINEMSNIKYIDDISDKIITNIINKILYKTHIHNPSRTKITVFHMNNVSNISIEKYIERIKKHAKIDNWCILYSLVLFQRYIDLNTNVLFNSNIIYRLLAISCLISFKSLYDIYYDNRYMSKIFGFDLNLLNFLELEFLHDISWKSNVSDLDLILFLTQYNMFDNNLKKDILKVFDNFENYEYRRYLITNVLNYYDNKLIILDGESHYFVK